ncbi:kinase-like domain-containing protein [Suillus clintonianus]|uniref:kinase-like domain-containing protein n=1 Tax=Suillus clintonianus TaxID=1904413 RepID=UPI001B86BFE1|nr:kinase-like domain-containing protein [Suillus clintonianus]KAG2134527.1 kinase-like domain-containing protein [Suillus clintonianus]
MVFLTTWIFNFVLPKRWTNGKSQPEKELSSSTESTHADAIVSGNDQSESSRDLTDLTLNVAKESTYAIAQGGFGDVWKCRFSDKDHNVEVAVKCVRIEIPDDHFKEIVNKRLMNDFHKWKPLRHDNIVSLCGITYGFGPVPAIVSPWMPNGSLSTYLNKRYDTLSEADKIGLLADVAAGLYYLHANEVAHADLTGSNVLIDSDGRALLADYGLLTTCSELNGTSYIRSNVRWAAPELFEVPETEGVPSSPKLESDIYSFGCVAYQVLSGRQPYYDIRSDHQVVVAILRGVKPKRPETPVIQDYHWDFIEKCWLEMSQRPPIAEVRDLMYRYRDAMY